MGYNAIVIFLLYNCCFVPHIAEAFYPIKSYQSTFDKRERDLSSCIDYHLDMILQSENYKIDAWAVKSAKQNLEFVRAKIQQYNQKCIDINQAFDYIKAEMETKFVNLNEYDIDKYKDSFYPCSQSDLTKKLYVEYEQKKPLPPRIEWGITICLFGYFVWLIPYPPFQVAGYAIMAYGAEKLIDGYFSEQDKNYDEVHRNE